MMQYHSSTCICMSGSTNFSTSSVDALAVCTLDNVLLFLHTFTAKIQHLDCVLLRVT